MSTMDRFRNLTYRLLKWSERYTKTDMVYLTRGGFWLSINQGLLMLIGFGTAVLFAHFLTPEEYGNFKYVLSVASLIGAFSLSAMGTAISRSVSQGNEGALTTGFALALQWGFGMVLIAGVGALYYYLNDNLTLAFALLLIASTSPLLSASSLYDAFLEGKQFFDAKALFGFIRNAVPALVVAGTIIATNNMMVLFVVYFVSNTAVAWWVYHRTVRAYQENIKDDPSLIAYGAHLSIMNILGVVTSQIDKILIFQMLGGTQLAIYAFAQAPITYLQTSTQMIKTLILPRFAGQRISMLRTSMLRKALQLFLFSTAIAGAYFLAAPLFYEIFFPAYAESVPYSQALALLLLLTPAILPAQVFLAHKKTRQLYFLRTVPPILRAVLMLILIPLYGVWGGVYAVLLYKSIESLCSVVLFLYTRDEVDNV
ncbi:MAG: oligosaccharide flippase family protein [Patescibacteria group bacterium]